MSNSLKPGTPLSAEKNALFALLLKKKRIELARVAPIKRATEAGPCPLSFAQQRLWFLDQLEPGSAAYNIPATMRLTAVLSVATLERTLDEVVRRHEVLRTVFISEAGQPRQVVRPHTSQPLEVIDLSHLPQAEREVEARLRAGEEARRPFDLMRGPLLRMSVLRLGAEEYALLITMHHIVSDWWSLEVLDRELRALYGAYATGQESPLEELPIQYGDYARWQREWLTGEVLEEQLGYWREQLAGAPPVLELPTDRPRPAIQTFRGAHLPFALGGELSEALRALGRREGATLFMTLLAGFQVLLSRYTGQDDIVVGTPIAGRTRAEVEGLIGFFVNTLVVRVRAEAGLSFREVLGRVRESCLGAYAHQDVPFEKLVEELHPERSLSHNPLFQVMFMFQSMTGQEPPLPVGAAQGEGVEAGAVTAKFDLTLSMTEGEHGLNATLEYNTDLFDAATVERMGGHLQVLLAAAVADPEQRIAELPLLTPDEHLQFVEWNDTARAYPTDIKSVHELFERQVARQPEAIAVVCEDEQLTYGELNKQADRLAHHLRALGVGAESRVGILLARSSRVLVALLGVWKAGGAYVPLEAEYPPERLSFMVGDAGVSVLLTERKLAGRVSLESGRVVYLDAEWLRDEGLPAAVSSPAVVADNLAYIIYTSGSTGTPKGVMISHGGIVNYLSWCAEAYGAAEGGGAPVHSPLGFDLTVTGLLAPLVAGGRVLMLPESEGINALGTVLGRERDLSLVKLTPAHLDLLSQILPAGEAGGRARAFVVGGEMLTAETLRFWREHAPDTRIVNEYGPTETVVGCCVYEVPPGALSQGTVAIGRPIANTQMYVLDARMRTVPPGVIGELYIGGAGVARGYVNLPALTAEKFVPDPFGRAGARLYRTGDLGRHTQDGNLEFLRRCDGQLKVRGYRIEPGEIEAVLRRHPSVSDALVVAHVGRDGDKRLVAYVVAVPERTPQAKELREHLLRQLPDYMVPSAFVTLDALPLTPNGKVDRRALPAPDATSDGLKDLYAAPRDVLELELCRIWEDVLNVKPVGVKENFFELGGHSLLAVRLIERVSRLTNTQVPLNAIFRATTIESLAALLREQVAPAPASSLVEIVPGDSRPPLFFVHPAGGNVFRYVELARLLTPGQAFYGLQAQGLDGELEAHAQVEQMAAHYVELIRGLRPSAGAYRLGGWSLGGLVAFEMARQLRASGEEVASVVLLDSYPSQAGESATQVGRNDLFIPFIQHLGLPVGNFFADAGEFRRLAEDARLAYVLERIMAAEEVYAQLGLKRMRRLFEVFEIHTRAARAYEPAPYDGRVELFFAADGDACARRAALAVWSGVAVDASNFRLVPGDHYSILERPNVAALAGELRARLQEVGQV
jgi:amino acid adenylation domain-containing protein